MAPKKRLKLRKFCYVCKKWIECEDEKEFRKQGHYGDKVSTLAPDIPHPAPTRHKAGSSRRRKVKK